jgi:anti-sigma factor RsiW
VSTLPQECRSFVRVVESFIDGELAPAALIEGERHIAECIHCHERVMLGRAMKGSVKAATREPLSSAAKARLRASMQAELARTPVAAKTVPLGRVAVGTLVTAGFAAAAAWFLAPRFSSNQDDLAANDDVLGELVAEHVRPLPMDGTDVQTVRNLEPYVGVPLRPHFPQNRARLVGARIVPFQKERAAIVRYELASAPVSPIAHVSQAFQAAAQEPTRRVSVLVFDPRRIHLSARVADLPAPFSAYPVHLTRAQGLPIAVTERNGVGYALSGDVSEQQALELVRYVAGE